MNEIELNLKLAEIDKTKPRRAGPAGTRQPCVLCGAELDPFDWSVYLKGLGRSHTHCAADRGFTIV